MDTGAIEFDPMCDFDKPRRIPFEDVTAAAYRIQGGVVKTSCIRSHISQLYQMDIYLKNEFLQHTGSFKERGARNTLLLLSPEARQRGVISASSGNHSQAMSYHGTALGVPTTVVMPVVAPIMKIEKCRNYGAKVIISGETLKEAKFEAMKISKENNLLYINGYDHPDILSGQGTVGLEILEQCPKVEAVLVPCGGGGLLAGVAVAIKHMKPEVLIYGIESEKCASMKHAFEQGGPAYCEIKPTLADGLAVSTVGCNSYHTSKPIVDKMIVVSEDWIARAILLLIEQQKYVVEGGGAIGLAAIMQGLVPELVGKRVCCILTGGNIDTTILGRCLERGLAAEKRLAKFKVTVSDKPGGIYELCKLISSIGVSIKDIIQERAWVQCDIFSVQAIEFDPMCNKDNPRRITFEDVTAAAFRIQGGVTKTSCVKSHISQLYGMGIYLKNEFLQHTGSFKDRGARNTLTLLSPEAKQRGVICASAGNHSQAIGYHGTSLGIPTTVVMPKTAPLMKVQKCRNYGSNVFVMGETLKEAKFEAMKMSKENNLLYINGYDHPDIIAGQGTVGLEILEQCPKVDAVLCPCGGGGLLAGVATAIKQIKPEVLIYGIESENCPSMKYAFSQGGPTLFETKPTLADGLAVPTVGYNAYHTCKSTVDKLIEVTEDWIARAILLLIEQQKYVVEGGGAVTLASIMQGLVPELAGKRVCCILTGGNIDTTILGRCLERGLAAEKRLIKFKVNVSDKPGGISELCKLISSIGVSIKDIIQERAWIQGDIFSVQVKVVCETRGPEHMDELRALISSSYKEWYFVGGI